MKLKPGFICTVLFVVALSTVLAITCFTSGANAQERKVNVNRSELPDAIIRAIEQAVPGGKIVKIEKEVEGEDPGQYDVEIRSGDKKYEVEISPEGHVIEVKEVTSVDDEAADAGQTKKWTDSFNIEDCTFSTVGRNRFFSLEPGYQLVLESDEERVVITVLDQTKMIGRVNTRVIEEREEKNGELAEVSRNFFAICKEHGDVFYVGEEVDDYEDGKIIGHGGAWRADEPDSRAGIIMPGTVLLGARHYQEISPKAMDRAEIVADDVTMETPAGTFKNCIRVEETSGLDPDEKCYKTYAPGIGIIQDEDLLLVRYSKAEGRGRQARKRPEDDRTRRGAEALLTRLERLQRQIEELRKEIMWLKAGELQGARSRRTKVGMGARRDRESEEARGRARVARPAAERAVMLRQIEVMRYALHALAEAEKTDAADLLERVIHARELMLEGRADEEATRIREEAPNRSSEIEILMLAERILKELGQTDRAIAVGRLAQELKGREAR